MIAVQYLQYLIIIAVEPRNKGQVKLSFMTKVEYEIDMINFLTIYLYIRFGERISQSYIHLLASDHNFMTFHDCKS